MRLARPADFDDFVRELGDAVGEVVGRYHTEEGAGRTFRVVAGSYPAPTPRADTSPTDEEEG